MVKNLANNTTSYTYSSNDSKIQKIERSSSLPEASVKTGIISSIDSPNEIVAWYDS